MKELNILVQTAGGAEDILVGALVGLFIPTMIWFFRFVSEAINPNSKEEREIHQDTENHDRVE
jgi:hypothetical protein